MIDHGMYCFPNFIEFSVLEKDFGPLAQLISSLVEVLSSVQPTSPLNELLIIFPHLRAIFRLSRFLFLHFFLSIDEIRVVELLFPSLKLAGVGFAEKSTVRSLKFAVTWLEICHSSIGHALVLSLSVSLGVGLFLSKSKGVNSVWTVEELGFAWIILNIFPAGVGPSTWDKFKVVSMTVLRVVTIAIDEIWSLHIARWCQ